MINYNNNNNFFKFIYKSKNQNKYVEANIEIRELTRIRFLKPRINFNSTKKIFEYKNYRLFNINTLFNSIPVYGNVKLELNNLGAYFKNISLKKKKIKIKLPWYITYNYINCIQNYLFFRNRLLKNKIKKFKIKTINYSYNKFKTININIKRKIEYFYKMKFSKIFKNFRNNWVMKRNFTEYIITQKQKKLVTTYRIKYGVFWSIFKLLNQISKETNLLINNNWNLNKINDIILKKYIILKSFIYYLLKLSFFTLKRASYRYLYLAKHLIIFFYNYLYKNILINIKKNLLNNILDNFNKDLVVINKVSFSIGYNIYNIMKNLYFINSSQILDIFGIFIVYILNIEIELKLFKEIKNNIKLNIDLYRSKLGKKKPAHFLDFVVFLNYFTYSFKKLLPNLKLKKKYKKKHILRKKRNLRLNKVLFNI